MSVGGYTIIDLGGMDISIPSKKIDGIYKRIEGSINKPILVKNFIRNGVEQLPFYGTAYFAANGDCYIVRVVDSGNILRFRIMHDDSVSYQTVPATAPAGDPGEDGPSASM